MSTNPTVRERYNTLLNRNNQEKRQDNFLVSFFDFDENAGNFLGRQVKSVTRPSMTVEVSNSKHKGNEYSNPGQLKLEPITVTFRDDENSITSMLLYAQLMRQREKYQDEVDHVLTKHNDKEMKFGLKVQMFNSQSEETEAYILRDAFITSIEHSELIMSSETTNEITIRLVYDNIEVKVFDRFVAYTK
jgi:hypothetical protein